MSTTTQPQTPAWRRSVSPPTSTNHQTSSSWRGRRQQSWSPSSSGQSSSEDERRERRVRSMGKDWRAKEERRPGEARTVAQRMADRTVREEKMNLLCAEKSTTLSEQVELYKSFKEKGNQFIDWLVDSVHNDGKNMDPAIIILPEGSNHKYKLEPVNHLITLTQNLINKPTIPAHIIKLEPVNHLITLTQQFIDKPKIPAHTIKEKLAPLSDIIHGRAIYSHWKHETSKETDAEKKYNEHQHFIDLLEDSQTMLRHHYGAELTATQTPTVKETTKPAATATIQRHNSTLGKRNRASSPPTIDMKQNKSAKLTALPASALQQRPMLSLRTGNKQLSTTEQVKECVPKVKTTSWARVAAIKA
ncbi:hypothetical protein ACLMJK_005109 [Lecanora helva]